MNRLTPEGTQIVADMAARHGMSIEAVETLLIAVANGHGTQAQFNHFELGGMGQWSQGGMTMIGDMFNNGLKARVAALAQDLSQALNATRMFAPQPQSASHESVSDQPNSHQSQSQSGGVSFFAPGQGPSDWPADLGQPSSTGAQNNLRYAVFPATRRLAISSNGVTEVYDTGDHAISGVSQQQGGDQSLTFTSQYGLVRVADLPKVGTEQATSARSEVPEMAQDPRIPKQSTAPTLAEQTEAPRTDSPPPTSTPATPPTSTQMPGGANSADAIISLIQKLADLRAGGILTDAEFEAKKSELLSRL